MIQPVSKQRFIVAELFMLLLLLVGLLPPAQRVLAQTSISPREFDVGSAAQSQATGDFNGDAHLDLAVANGYSFSISVLLGDGHGAFGSRLDLALPASPLDVLIADFNGDSKLDISAISGDSDFGWVMLGNGVGGFGSPIAFSSPTEMRSFVAGDLNGDGKSDLVITHNYSPLHILFGDGTGRFPTGTTLTQGLEGLLAWDAALGDFNRDGKNDIVTANYITSLGSPSQNITIMYGDGVGGFSSAQAMGNGFEVRLHVVVTDMNNDGNLDLLATDTTALYVLLGSGNGTFSQSFEKNFGTSEEKALAVGDFNNDANQDVIVMDPGFQQFYLLFGTGNGILDFKGTVPRNYDPLAPITGDFNEDGQVDFAVLGIDPPVPPDSNNFPSHVVVYTAMPVVPMNDRYSTNQNTLLTIAAPGVLANDASLEGYALTAALGVSPSHGTATLNSNGSLTYRPAANYNGSDSFTYTVSDGHGDTATAIVSITITPVTTTHRNVAVFLQGISTQLTPTDIVNQINSGHRATSIVGMGYVPAPTINGVLPSNTQYFQYSYARSKPDTGNPVPYTCRDTFSSSVYRDILLLEQQISNITGTQPVGTETDFYLIGHSLGGAVALGYLDFLAQGLLQPLPPTTHLKAVITLDAPIGGVSDFYTADSILRLVYSSKCDLTDISFTSQADLNKVFLSTSKTSPAGSAPQGARASFLVLSPSAGRLPRPIPSNANLAEKAQVNLGTSFLSIGNQNDFLWNPSACRIPKTPDIRDSQYNKDKGDGSGVYSRFIAPPPSSCPSIISGGINGKKKLIISSHEAVLNDADVQSAITNFLRPIMSGSVGGTPSPLHVNPYQSAP